MLRTCAALTAEPHLYLRDLLGGPETRRDLAPRPRALTRWDGWFDRVSRACSEAWRLAWNGFAVASNAWNGPICRAAERATSLCYRLPLVGNLGALALITAFRPYRPPLRPFLSSRMPRLASLFFHSMEEEGRRMVQEAMQVPSAGFPMGAAGGYTSGAPTGQTPWWHDPLKGTLFHSDSAQAIAAAAAAALYVALYPIDKLLGLPAWLGAVGTRFAILIGARAAAGGAPGVDVLAAAFRPARTGQVPDGGTDAIVPEEIERDIERRVGEASRIDFAVLRAGIDPAHRASLLETVHVAFTDVGLLHAQYYQDSRIIDYVARCIAGQSPLEWPKDAPGAEAPDTSAAAP